MKDNRLQLQAGKANFRIAECKDPWGFPPPKDLNVVSLINSICFAFGSGITTNNTGILLQNRGVNFRLESNHPNNIEGNKRPLHTIIPGLLTNKENE